MASLEEILTQIELADDMALDLDVDELAELGDNLRDKIDSYKQIMDYIEGRSRYLALQIKELTDAKRAFDNKLGSIKEHMAHTMHVHGFKKMAGKKYQVRLGEYQKVLAGDADLNTWRTFPGLVRASFAWDKTKLKTAETLPPGVSIEKTYSPIFSVLKEAK